MGQKKELSPLICVYRITIIWKNNYADEVYKELKKLDIPLERIDSRDIRELIPNVGFSREERNRHIKRIGHLIQTLQKNSISTVL